MGWESSDVFRFNLGTLLHLFIFLFIYLGFYVAFNTVQVISRQVVGRAEETSTYSSSGFCTVNCRPTGSNYQLSHLRPCREPNPGLRGGRRVLPLFHRFPWAPLSRSNDGSLALMSWFFGGCKFASVLRCVGLVCRESSLNIF